MPSAVKLLFPRSVARWIFTAALLLLPAAAALGQNATVTAALIPSNAQPSQSVTLKLVIDIAAGLHAQSHTPSDANYIPFEIKLDPNADITFEDIQYPQGKNETYPELGTLNVYTGQVTIEIKGKVNPGAGKTPLHVTGFARSQICNDKVCFPPKRLPFDSANATPSVAPVEIDSGADTVFGFRLGDNTFSLAFAAAFVVGILFNAMPCVLPVVPLKIMGFYEASQHDRRKCLTLGVVFSLGLIASFAVLSVLVVGFRVLDWGGLFQKPLFTAVIVFVLLAMAISQFGFFTVNLPTSVYRFAPRHDTYMGNFLFGVLTAALSTPCTIGMFVALLAWALKQPAIVGVSLVIMVGVGMAAPYLLLSGFPELARRFPRTGPLGEIVKQVMAFLLLATAVYFAWPFFERFISARAFWWTLFAVIAAGGFFLVGRTMQMFHTRRATLIAAVIALVFTAPACWATMLITRQPYNWQPYTDQTLADARAQGRPVLIDFTATWCGNCHYVEAFVLNDSKVVSVVVSQHVMMLKADVTNDDAPARALLGQLNAAGAIPLTAIYLPNKTEPKLLTGIYSTDAVIAAINAK